MTGLAAHVDEKRIDVLSRPTVRVFCHQVLADSLGRADTRAEAFFELQPRLPRPIRRSFVSALLREADMHYRLQLWKSWASGEITDDEAQAAVAAYAAKRTGRADTGPATKLTSGLRRASAGHLLLWASTTPPAVAAIPPTRRSPSMPAAPDL